MNGIELITYALGWTLLHSLWQISLLALLLYLVLLLCQRSDAQFRHGMAVVGLILAASLPAYTFLDIYIEEQKTAAFQKSMPTEKPETAYFQISEVVSESTPETDAWIQFKSWLNRHIYWVSTFWLIGVVILSLRFTGSLWYLHHLRRGNLPLPERWQSKGHEIAHLLEIRRPIQFLASFKVKTPMMIGVLKPVVLLPASLLTQLPADQVEAILAHEIAHIYRKDYLVNLLQSVLEIIFFFHPALWWMSSLVKEEREKCCDDLAVMICGNSMAYVKALACVEEYRQNPGLALAMSGKGSGLLQRIERLLSPERSGNRLMPRMLSGSLAIILLTLLLSAKQGAMYQEVKKQAEIGGVYLKELVPETWKEEEHLPPPMAQVNTLVKLSEKSRYAIVEKEKADTVPAPKAPKVVVLKNDSLENMLQHFSYDIDSLVGNMPAFSFNFSDDSVFSFNVTAPDAPHARKVFSFSALHASHPARTINITSDSTSRIIRLNHLDSLIAISINGSLSETFKNIDTAFVFNFDPQNWEQPMFDNEDWEKTLEEVRKMSRFYESINDSTLKTRMRELQQEMRVKEKELQKLMEAQQELLQEKIEKQRMQMEEQQEKMQEEGRRMQKEAQKQQLEARKQQQETQEEQKMLKLFIFSRHDDAELMLNRKLLKEQNHLLATRRQN
ncbi:MAG: M56 family metallopeptidase [Cyclobacteriaceae bacterium]